MEPLFCRNDWVRTSDLTPPRRVRYQLRYIPICSAKIRKKSEKWYLKMITIFEVDAMYSEYKD